MQIIPAIDIIDGKCVRLTQGDFSQQKSYHNDPLEVAKMFEGAGITRLHLVDLDGARQKKIVNLEVLQKIAGHTSLHIDFGGGIQSDNDIEAAFSHGAKQVTGGSIAIKDPEMFGRWLLKYGAESIILGADAKDGKIAVHGWQETSEVLIEELIGKFRSQGIQYVICTDVAKDGLLQGPSFDLYRTILSKFPDLKLIASGGVSNIDDLARLKELGVYGAIVGKAYYEGRITLKELSSLV